MRGRNNSNAEYHDRRELIGSHYGILQIIHEIFCPKSRVNYFWESKDFPSCISVGIFNLVETNSQHIPTQDVPQCPL